MCLTRIGNCPIPQAAPGHACACFAPYGPVQGKAGPQMVPASPQYCCTKQGKIGPLQNLGAVAGKACSATLPSRASASGTTCF
jgi:hypothetical protein